MGPACNGTPISAGGYPSAIRARKFFDHPYFYCARGLTSATKRRKTENVVAASFRLAIVRRDGVAGARSEPAPDPEQSWAHVLDAARTSAHPHPSAAAPLPTVLQVVHGAVWPGAVSPGAFAGRVPGTGRLTRDEARQIAVNIT
jgi:hypothetical protein